MKARKVGKEQMEGGREVDRKGEREKGRKGEGRSFRKTSINIFLMDIVYLSLGI